MVAFDPITTEELRELRSALSDEAFDLLLADDEGDYTEWLRRLNEKEAERDQVDAVLAARDADAKALRAREDQALGGMHHEHQFRQVRQVVNGGRPETNRQGF